MIKLSHIPLLLLMSAGLSSLVFHSTKADECPIIAKKSLQISFNGFIPTTPILINGKEVRMGIDTGAQRTVISLDLARRLDLPQDLQNYTNVSGTAGSYKAPNIHIETLEFAGSTFHQLSLPALSMELPILTKSQLPMPIEGVIGVDILSHYDLDVDFPHHQLTLYTMPPCQNAKPNWSHSYTTIPVTITSTQRIAVPLTVDGHAIDAIFDTAANGERLTATSLEKAGITRDTLNTDPLQNGSGIGGGVYKTHSHLFHEVTVGNNTYKNISFDVVNLGSTEADALLGEDYIKARHFWLSYAAHKIYIDLLGEP